MVSRRKNNIVRDAGRLVIILIISAFVVLPSGIEKSFGENHGKEVKVSIDSSQTIFTFENIWIKRTFKINKDKGISTKSYLLRTIENGPWLPLFTFDPYELPYDAAVSINGIEGLITATDKPKLKIKSSFVLEDYKVVETVIGKRLDFSFRPQPGSKHSDIRVTLHHELSNNLPFLIKWMTVENLSGKEVSLDGATVEVFHSAQKSLVSDDYCTSTGSGNPDLPGWTFYRFPVGPKLPLSPGDKVETFHVYELFPTPDPFSIAVERNRLLRAVAPWTRTQEIFQMWQGCKTLEEMYPIIDDAANSGIETVGFFVGQWETKVGDFKFKPEIFPNGEADLKRIVNYAHSKGLRFVLYTGMCIGSESSETTKAHPDWQFLSEGGFRFSAGAHGNMCLAGPWGKYWQDNIFRLTDMCGIDGWQTDGPYYADICYEKGHTHNTPESSQYLNWLFEKSFYEACIKRNILIQTPQGWHALLHGARQIPGGYTEEDQVVLEGLDLISTFRSHLFDNMLELPPTVRWTFVSFDKYHGKSMYLAGASEEKRLAMYEHSIAGCFGYGHAGHILTRKLYNSPLEREIFLKWINFYKQYRKQVENISLPLIRPDGKHIDGIFHCNPETSPKGVLVAFNPSETIQRAHFMVPVRYAGIKNTATAGPQGKILCRLDVDSQGNAPVTMELKPYEVTWWEIEGK